MPIWWKSDKDHWQSTTIIHHQPASGRNLKVGDDFLKKLLKFCSVESLNCPFGDEDGIQCGRGYSAILIFEVPISIGHTKPFWTIWLRCYQTWNAGASSIDFDAFDLNGLLRGFPSHAWHPKVSIWKIFHHEFHPYSMYQKYPLISPWYPTIFPTFQRLFEKTCAALALPDLHHGAVLELHHDALVAQLHQEPMGFYWKKMEEKRGI